MQSNRIIFMFFGNKNNNQQNNMIKKKYWTYLYNGHLPDTGLETFNDEPLAVSLSLRLIPIQPPILTIYLFPFYFCHK